MSREDMSAGEDVGTSLRQVPGGQLVHSPTFSIVDKGTPVFAQIADQLIRAINAGELPIGARLPSEAALSDQFKVSRASVREALSSLQFAGYLESSRGSGTLVRSTVAQGTGQLRGMGLRRPGDIVNLLEARLAIEPETIRQAAVDPVPVALRKLGELLEGMQLAVGRPEFHAHTDIGVHLALVRTCKNPFLARTSEHLLARADGRLWRSVRDRAWEDGQLPRDWLGHHEAIVRAVTEHDADRAGVGMQAHLLSVLQNVALSAPLSAKDRQRVEELTTRYETVHQDRQSSNQPAHPNE